MAKEDLKQILGASVTVDELIGAMEDLGAGLAQYVTGGKGGPLAAIVLIHGPDTAAYLSAIDQRGRDLAVLRTPAGCMPELPNLPLH